MTAETLNGLPLGLCATDPARWEAGDSYARAGCRACPRRWPCAREALATRNAEGLWAGVFIPPRSHNRPTPARRAALTRLRNLVENYGT